MTEHVHVASLMLHFRGYAHGIEVNKPLYMMTDAYIYHSIALLSDDGVARLQGFEGFGQLDAITRLKHFKEILRKCGNHGARIVKYRHNDIEHTHNLEKRGWTTTNT